MFLVNLFNFLLNIILLFFFLINKFYLIDVDAIELPQKSKIQKNSSTEAEFPKIKNYLIAIFVMIVLTILILIAMLFLLCRIYIRRN